MCNAEIIDPFLYVRSSRLFVVLLILFRYFYFKSINKCASVMIFLDSFDMIFLKNLS